MKKGQFIFLLITYVWLSTSCEKSWFDVKSDKSVTVLSTLEDFELLLDNHTTVTRSSPGLGEVASDGHYTPDNRWITLVDEPLFISQKNAYTWSKKNLNTLVYDWDIPYKVILYCNLVLEGLQKIDRNENKALYDRVKGNALFHRARVYLELSQQYTPPYEINKDSKYGLPFKKSTDVSEKMDRKTVHETFDIIRSDLELAATLLPVRQSPVSRGSKVACWGLLARLSLVVGMYNDALDYASMTLEVQSDLLDFDEVSNTISRPGLFNKEVIFHAELVSLLLIVHPRTCFIDSSLFEEYEDNDLRKNYFFSVGTTGINFRSIYTNSTVLFSGLATDEMYLIQAEAYARLDKIKESMDLLNVLLRSRYRRNSDGSSTLVNRTAVVKEDALRIIFSERRKELLMRGLRWSDLRRLNLDPRYAKTLTRTVVGEKYTLTPNSYRYTFPLPDDEISFSGLVQNPGWK